MEIAPHQWQEIIRHYSEEIKVMEGNRAYWLPIQPDVLESLETAITKDDRFTVFVRWVGAINDQRVYLIMDYDQEVRCNAQSLLDN